MFPPLFRTLMFPPIKVPILIILSGVLKMQETEAQQLILDIINQAQSGQSFKFHFITSWREFRYYSKSARATALLIRTLESSAEKLFKSYCKDVSVGTADVTKLFAYTEIKDIIAFYEQDLETLQKMLDDYDDYLGKGNFLYAFWGGERYF
jgi:hypothetical protein